MLFSDLLPYIAQLAPPIGGPQIPIPPKAQSSFTGLNVPPVRMSTPSEMLATMTAMSQAPSEIKLREAQGQLYGFQGQQAAALANYFKSAAEPPPAGFGQHGSGQTSAGGSVIGSLDGGAGPSSGGGSGGWGPLATPAISAMKNEGASDAFTQAAMGHGLAEGGFNDPWRAGDNGNSFGHWQFNQGGELPGYLAWAQGKGDPKDTALQARYVTQRAEQLHPGITKTNDPRLAMDVLGTKFERYKGNGPGQRSGYLADAQKAMAGGALEPRMSIPDLPGQVGGLPGVPNFAGMMTGNQGPSYAPAAPASAPDSVIGSMSGGAAPAFGGMSPGPAAAQMAPPQPQGGGISSRYSPADIAWAQQQDRLNKAMGKSNPIFVENALQTGPGGMKSPEVLQEQAAATERGKRGVELQYAAPLESTKKNIELQYTGPIAAAGAPYQSPYAKAALAAQLFPPGSPERRLADLNVAKEAGVTPVLGGVHPGVPIRQYNPATGQYEIAAQNPSLEHGQILAPDGTVSNAPGYIPSLAAREATLAWTKVAPAIAQAMGEPRTLGPEQSLVVPGGMGVAPTTSPSMPGTNLGVGGGVLRQGMNPLYHGAVNAAVTSDQNRLSKELQPMADKANETMATAQLIGDLSPRVQQGWGANTIADAARVMTALGVSEPIIKSFTGTNAASADVLGKMFLAQTASAVRVMGAREPGSVISLFGKAYPSLETQPNATNLIENVLYMQGQRQHDEYALAQQYHTNSVDALQTGASYKPLSSFTAEFNSSTGPHASVNYLKAAQAMSNDQVAWKDLKPEQIDQIVALIPQGKHYIAPNGQPAIRR